MRPFLTQFFLTFGDQDLALVSQLAGIYVCDQDGGTPLDSDLDQGAGEEANSPAGGARGDGGVVVEGANCSNIKILSESISAFRECEGLFARSLGLCIFSRECWNQKF